MACHLRAVGIAASQVVTATATRHYQKLWSVSRLHQSILGSLTVVQDRLSKRLKHRSLRCDDLYQSVNTHDLTDNLVIPSPTANMMARVFSRGLLGPFLLIGVSIII